jgi:alkylated DNA repair dioxygenase AlkB
VSPASTVIADHATGSFVTYVPGFLAPAERLAMRADIERHHTSFEVGTMLVAGREVPTPRMAVAFGDGNYRYPDMGESLPWPATLAAARSRLEACAGHRFNYALVNIYRDGRDFTGWHADKMRLHVAGSAIAVISLGAVRPLCFRPQDGGEPTTQRPLEDGSLLWMRGETQAHYEHAVPRDDGLAEVRLSVTFRYVVERLAAGS